MSKIASTDLRVVMEGIASVYSFVPEKYPELKGKSAREIQEFAVGHSALHMMKSLGPIAGESEKADHGMTMDMRTLKVAAAKQVINALNLANALNMSADELLNRIARELK